MISHVTLLTFLLWLLRYCIYVFYFRSCYYSCPSRHVHYHYHYHGVRTSNHMFKREIWDKLTEFTFLKFSKNEQGKFSPNVTDKHVIPG